MSNKKLPAWDMRQYTYNLWEEFEKVFEFRHGSPPNEEDNLEEYQYFIAGWMACVRDERGDHHKVPWV